MVDVEAFLSNTKGHAHAETASLIEQITNAPEWGLLTTLATSQSEL